MHKKAWQFANGMTRAAVPVLQTEEEKQWTENKLSIGDIDIEETRARWCTRVPGSRAPDYVFIGGIQATENMGYDVSEAEAMMPAIQRAYDEHDDAALLMLTAKLLNVLGRAPKVTGHPYWSYCYYNSFEDHAAEVHFPAPVPLAFSEAQRLERVHSGWLAQIAGAAVGTIIEGYCTDQLRSAFGEIRGYLRQPTTYNDDVLFELAFLNAYRAKGRAVTSEDIGMEWVGRIEYTWSGEEAAFKNMKRGIFPPHSATVNNPWREWIGAQMRGAICGMVAPGDPELAARLAWTDGAVSHVNNGVLGEVFNAMLVALAYTEHSVRTVLEKAIALLPARSEYYSVVRFAWEACEKHSAWEPAWRECEKKYERYNWIHTYPNAAAEVVSLYFGGDSFDECMHICAMCGQDVDCNAGQIGTVYGVMQGYAGIREQWTAPFEDKFDSLFRGYEHTTITRLAQDTLDAWKYL
ncbi:MAG: ADP-ribosylglycohydrolase family protein [Ruthenibacterium sp.]|jgi:ADP-ribosylglycohydrolase